MATQEHEALRLRSLLESAPSTPGDVAASCHAAESVCRHSPRLFFRLCFPVLLRRIFGFEDLQQPQPAASSGGWLSVVGNPGNEPAAAALTALLAPGGAVIRSLLASDSDGAVRYVFPPERLPDWVRRVLAVERGPVLLESISILFRGRLRFSDSGLQIELDAFQYYIFWFAYYAVCKESPAAARKPRISRSSQLLKTQIESWANSIPGRNLYHHHHQQGNLVSPLHPYLQLLQLYLSHFVGPSMLRREKDGLSLWRAEDSISHADVLVQSLIDFWLVDDDPCPFPLSVCQSLQLHTLSPPPVYAPPGREISDAARITLNFFGAMLQTRMLENHEALFSSPESTAGFRRKAAFLADVGSTAVSPVTSVGVTPYMQAMQRPLYRFVLRAFRFWPVGGTPVTRVVPVVDLWLQYLEPWAAVLLVPKDSTVQPGSRVYVHEMNREYSGYWQGYVLSSYSFYTSLVAHFLEFALKFLLVDMELVFQTTCKVLNVLSKSDELLDLLRSVDAACTNHFLGRQYYVSSAFADRISAIQEQLQDWEEGISDSEQEQGEMLRAGNQFRISKLQLFAPTEYGGHHILQTMILQAEAEIRACCIDRLPVSQKTLETTKALVKKVFNQDVYSPVTRTPSGNPLPPETEDAETDSPRVTSGLQKHTWADVKYKGDWMRRPIESQEIGWLVRLLVHISDAVNERLRFSRVKPAEQQGEEQEETRGSDDQAVESSCPDAVKPILKSLAAAVWFLVGELRKRGFRVNLRPLAQKQVIAAVLVVLLFYRLMH